SLFDGSIPGIPHFVYTDHTRLACLQYPEFNPRDLPGVKFIELEKQVYQNATLNFTMSSNISQSLIEDYSCSPQQISCVYCGANIQVKKDESFTKDRYKKKNILFVGKKWGRKGGELLAEAFPQVLDSHPDAVLTIVGCTPDLNLPNCNIVGTIPLADVKAYFKQASIFCLPTRIEPFGIVFLEAMACKLPIVASNIGAIPEFVIEGRNGYMIGENDPQQLAQRIIELIDSPEKCETFGEYGHKLLWDRYTWEQTGLRIRKNIEQFL
ncbi:MAG: glycosyltransferase family 4 protein, partial [Cyanobacteria bacterium J06558_2]